MRSQWLSLYLNLNVCTLNRWKWLMANKVHNDRIVLRKSLLLNLWLIFFGKNLPLPVLLNRIPLIYELVITYWQTCKYLLRNLLILKYSWISFFNLRWHSLFWSKVYFDYWQTRKQGKTHNIVGNLSQNCWFCNSRCSDFWGAEIPQIARKACLYWSEMTPQNCFKFQTIQS